MAKSLFSAKTSLFGDQVHDRRFADVRVADQCDADQLAPVAALHGHLLVYLLELLFQAADAVAHDTAVGLDFSLAGPAAGSRAATLPFEVCPHAGQAWQQVLALRQFDLCFGIGRSSPLCENFEDQAGAVVYLAGKNLIEVADLRRAQLIVENHEIHFVLFDIGSDFGQFPFSHEGS